MGVGDGPAVGGQVKDVVGCFVGDGEGPAMGGRDYPRIGAKVGEATVY